MAEQSKPGWWQTIPGLLTAAAAFIAALTGLLAGLNQLGFFDGFREPEEQVATAAAPPPADTVRATAPPEPADSAPAEPVLAPRPAPRVRPTPRAAAPEPPSEVPAPVDTAPAAVDTAPAPPADTAADTVLTPPVPAAEADTAEPPRDTVSAPDTQPIVQPAPEAPDAVLPRGTVLELAASSRVCSTTSSEGDRFNATLVVPIAVESGVALPVGTTAVLEIERLPAPTFIGVRLDSIVREGSAVAVPDAEARARREFVAGAGEEGVGVGACVPLGGRITARLKAPVRLGGS